jgi:hypothetical protein
MGRGSALFETIRKHGRMPGFAGLADLGERLFDEAMVVCESEREAAAMASADLIALLERSRTATLRPVDRPSPA